MPYQLESWRFFLAFALIPVTAAYARQFHVAPAGADANAGGESAPWKTFAKAMGMLAAGDTLFVREGTYKERLVVKKSGTAAAPILIAAYPGEKPVLDGTGLSGQGLVHLDRIQNVKVGGLEARNAGEAGFWIVNSSYITLAGNRTYNTVSSGIIVSEGGACDHVVLDGNEVELACNDGAQECISVAKCAFFEVKNNHVHHGGPGTTGGEGIDIKFGSHDGTVYGNHVHDMKRQGIYVDAWTSHTYNIEVFGNRVHDNEGDGFDCASEQGGLLENVTFHDNIGYNNKLNGFAFRVWGDGMPGPRKGIRIINNTFYNNGAGLWGPRGGIAVEGTQFEACVIRNNLLSANKLFQIFVEQDSTLAAFTIDHNLLDAYKGAVGEARGEAYVSGSPLFADASTGDFRLQTGSPAIDKGSPEGAPKLDAGGLSRPAGTDIDIGAHEFGASASLGGSRERLGSIAPMRAGRKAQVLFKFKGAGVLANGAIPPSR
ncbi:MAG: right-handed parallel beta-helix repeat-containing protein [Fibrobacteria bacterium]